MKILAIVLVLWAGAAFGAEGAQGMQGFDRILRDTAKFGDPCVGNLLTLAQYEGYGQGYDGYFPGAGERKPVPNYGPGYTLVCDAAGNCRPVVFGPTGQNGPVFPQNPWPVYPWPDGDYGYDD